MPSIVHLQPRSWKAIVICDGGHWPPKCCMYARRDLRNFSELTPHTLSPKSPQLNPTDLVQLVVGREVPASDAALGILPLFTAAIPEPEVHHADGGGEAGRQVGQEERQVQAARGVPRSSVIAAIQNLKVMQIYTA